MEVKRIIKSIATLRGIRERYKKRMRDKLMYKQKFIPIHQTQAQDIFVAGFPKSGNTWMQNLLAGVIYGVDTSILPDRLTQVLVPDTHQRQYYKRYLDFACFKTHNLPQAHYKKVVYLVRDGRDAMVSYYQMLKGAGAQYGLEEMVKNGTGVFPTKWHEHIKAWTKNPYNASIIQIRYEDLHKLPLIEMRRFCDFAGLDRSDEILQRSIDGNVFSKMQQKEEKYGWDVGELKYKFIRKGQVGSFKKGMSEHIIALFEQEASEQLIQMGYKPVSGLF